VDYETLMVATLLAVAPAGFARDWVALQDLTAADF